MNIIETLIQLRNDIRVWVIKNLNAKVSTSRTINGKELTDDITLSASDVGAATSDHTHPSYAAASDVSALKTLVGDTKVETQIGNAIASKQNTITGAATSITGSNLTANRALVSDASGKVAVSAVTSTELGYLDGVTSAIQTQLNTLNEVDSEILAACANLSSAVHGKADASHGNHVPATETADNAKFLRNDNTWQTVTPDNIGALPRSGGTMTGNLDMGSSNLSTNSLIISGSGNETASITNHQGIGGYLRFNFGTGATDGYGGTVILTRTGAFYPIDRANAGVETDFILGKDNDTEHWDQVTSTNIYAANIIPRPEWETGSSSKVSNLGYSTKPWDQVYVKTFYFTEKPTSVSSAPNTHIVSNGTTPNTWSIVFGTGSSSRTIKHDIKLLENDDLKAENLYNLNIYQAKYNEDILSDKDCRYLKDLPMLIIEELDEVYPVAVDKNSKDVKEWSWNSRYLIPPMLKLIQDQKKEIDTLKEEMASLKTLVSA